MTWSLTAGESSLVRVDGGGTPVPVEQAAMFSPDGRWVAYSVGALTDAEFWVRPEPAVPNARWLVSGNVGYPNAFWSRDGRELFFRDRDDRWQSVTVRGARPDGPFELGPTVPVTVPADVYDLRGLTPDGSRFLAYRSLEGPQNYRLAIVLNFFEELRAKVPVR